jgi:hypothetical protein
MQKFRDLFVKVSALDAALTAGWTRAHEAEEEAKAADVSGEMAPPPPAPSAASGRGGENSLEAFTPGGVGGDLLTRG